MPPGSHFCQVLEAVIHVKLDGMRCHTQPGDALHVQVYIGVNQVIAEDTALFEKVAVRVERTQGLSQ